MEYARALEHLLPALDAVYDAWDASAKALQTQLAQEKPSINVTCRKGCGACCHFPLIPATAGEAFVLLNRLLAAGFTLEALHAQFFDYTKAYFAQARSAGTLPFTDAQQSEFLKLKLPCPLFVREGGNNPMAGHCSVFGARPLICDYYNSTDSPALCHSKKPHLTYENLIARGEGAVEEVRGLERQLFGRSALGHLPLLLSSLCTEAGMQAFLNDDFLLEGPAENFEDQAARDFELYMEMLACAGYQMQAPDIHSLIEAQEELQRKSRLPD